MEENIKRKDWDEICPQNNLQWKWQWFKEFYFLKYTRTKECPHSVCKTRLCVWVWVCLGIQTGTYNKRNNRVPSWKKAPVCQTCTKHMRGVAKMLEYKQKRNNGRTPFAGVYKFERVRHRLWGTCNNRTIVPRKEIQWHNGTPQEKF